TAVDRGLNQLGVLRIERGPSGDRPIKVVSKPNAPHAGLLQLRHGCHLRPARLYLIRYSLSRLPPAGSSPGAPVGEPTFGKPNLRRGSLLGVLWCCNQAQQNPALLSLSREENPVAVVLAFGANFVDLAAQVTSLAKTL